MEEWADCLIGKGTQLYQENDTKILSFATIFTLSQSDLLTVAQKMRGGLLEGLGGSAKPAVAADRAGLLSSCLLHPETRLSVQEQLSNRDRC